MSSELGKIEQELKNSSQSRAKFALVLNDGPWIKFLNSKSNPHQIKKLLEFQTQALALLSSTLKETPADLRVFRIRHLFHPVPETTLSTLPESIFIGLNQQHLTLTAEPETELSPLTLEPAAELVLLGLFRRSARRRTILIKGEQNITLINYVLKIQRKLRILGLYLDEPVSLGSEVISLPLPTNTLIFNGPPADIDSLDLTQLQQPPSKQKMPETKKGKLLLASFPAPLNRYKIQESSQKILPSEPPGQVQKKTVTRRQAFDTASARSKRRRRLVFFGLPLVSIGLFLIILFPVWSLFYLSSRQQPETLDPSGLPQISSRLNTIQYRYQEGIGLLRQISDLIPSLASATISLSDSYTMRYQTLKTELIRHRFHISSHQALSLLTGKLPGDPFSHIYTAAADAGYLYRLLTETRNSAVFGAKANGSGVGEPAKFLKYERLLSLIPQLLNPYGKTTVMVLIQNHLELRPTGGFIGDVALATFDKGKLVNLEFKNVYQLDSLLNGQVQPPETLTRYLGESNWYLRDSNWDPDFIHSAAQAEWFLEKELDRTVDLTVAVTGLFLKEALAPLGPISLPGGGTVTASNFDSVILETASTSSDDQSNSLSVLGDIAQTSFQKFLDASPQQQLEVLSGAVASADNQQLLIYSRQPQTFRHLIDLGYAGQLHRPICPDESQSGCIVDPFYYNEANVGINYANSTVARSHRHQIDYTRDKVNHQHVINFTNTSSSTQWPMGDYKTFARLYLPVTAQLEKIVLVGETPVPLQPEQMVNDTLQNLSFYFEIPAGSSRTLEISYYLPVTSPLTHHAFSIQKQPGTLNDPLSLSLSATAPYRFKSVNHSPASAASFHENNTVLSGHQTMLVEFQP
jgi:hypothetical protein